VHPRFRYVDPLATPDWDDRISAHRAGTIFHTVGWSRVLASTYGFRPQFLVREAADSSESILPLLEVRDFLTGHRAVSLPFTDSVEPLVPDPSTARELFEKIRQEAGARRWKYVELRGWPAFPDGTPESLSYYGHKLELNRSQEELFRAFSEGAQRGVRKAQKSDVTIEIAQSEAAIRDYYRLHCLTRQRQGSPPQPLRFFLNIQRHLLAQGKGCVVIARHQERTVAGAVFLNHSDHAVYKFGASDESFQRLRANNLVMWSAIQHFSARGFRLIDFGRTSLAHSGLRRFKLGWGTQEETIRYVRFSPERGYLQTPDQTSGWQTRVFQLLPRPVSRLAGVLLYRHIA